MVGAYQLAFGRSLPTMVSNRSGQVRCNRWSERMQTDGQVQCYSAILAKRAHHLQVLVHSMVMEAVAAAELLAEVAARQVFWLPSH